MDFIIQIERCDGGPALPIPKIPGWNFHAPTSKSVKIPEVEPAEAPELSDEDDKSQLPPLPKTNIFAPPLPPPIEQKPAKSSAIPARRVRPDGETVDENAAKSAEAESQCVVHTLVVHPDLHRRSGACNATR